MPRNVIEVPLVKTGLITNIEGRDLPEDYLVKSVNVDPLAPAGRIQGIKAPGSSIADVGTAYDAVKAKWIQKSDGKYTLVYDDGTDIKYVSDFYGTKSAGSVLTSTDMKCAQANNEELHIGTGSGSTNKPKWVGYIQHGQFGATASTALQNADAELTIGEDFGGIYKAVTDDTYIYACSNDGHYIYKFTINGRTFTAKSSYFDNVISICYDPTNTKLIALCQIGASYWLYTLTTALVVSFRNRITTTLTEHGGVPSDIEVSKNKVWISCWLASNSYVLSSNEYKFLWMAVIPTAEGTASFDAKGIDGDQFYYEDSPGVYMKCTSYFTPLRKGLVRLDTNTGTTSERIGLLGGCYSNESSWLVAKSGGGYYTCDLHGENIMLVVGEDYTARGDLASVDGNKDKADICFLHATPGVFGDNLGAHEYYPYLMWNTNSTNSKRIYLFKVDSGNTTIHSYQFSDVKTMGLFSSDNDTGTAANTGAQISTLTAWDNGTGIFREHDDDNIAEIFTQDNGSWFYQSNTTSDTWGTFTSAIQAKISMAFANSGISSGGVLTNTYEYFYRVSYLFDGYQESPLSSMFTAASPTSDNWFTLTIYLRDIGSSPNYEFNKKRVTAIRVYRAEGGAATTTPSTLYRLVKEIDIKDTNYGVVTENNLTGRKIVFVEDSTYGPSYEANTGMSETIDTSIVNYELSAKLNGFHYVAKCYKTELPDAPNMIFRSKQGRFDMFDWTAEYLRLPFVPVQITAFAGRLFVWGNNKILRINPDLYVEDEYEGYGLASGLEPAVNDYGMFWFDDQSMYQMHPNGQIEDIGYPVRVSYDSNFISFATTTATIASPSVVYSREKDCMLFTNCIVGNTALYCWAYSFSSKSWFYWLLNGSLSSTAFCFSGKNDEIYVANHGANTLKQLFGFASSYYEPWEIVTKKYDAGLSGQSKKWYMARYTGAGNPTVTYGVNDAAYSNLTSAVNSSTFKLNAMEKARNIQFKIVGGTVQSSTLYYLDSFEIVFRELIGKR